MPPEASESSQLQMDHWGDSVNVPLGDIEAWASIISSVGTLVAIIIAIHQLRLIAVVPGCGDEEFPGCAEVMGIPAALADCTKNLKCCLSDGMARAERLFGLH